MTAALLYYLPSSTLAVAALFLLADLIERWRNDGTRTDADDEDAPFLNPELLPTPGVNLDDDEEVLIGRVIPAATAFLGLAQDRGRTQAAGATRLLPQGFQLTGPGGPQPGRHIVVRVHTVVFAG